MDMLYVSKFMYCRRRPSSDMRDGQGGRPPHREAYHYDREAARAPNSKRVRNGRSRIVLYTSTPTGGRSGPGPRWGMESVKEGEPSDGRALNYKVFYRGPGHVNNLLLLGPRVNSQSRQRGADSQKKASEAHQSKQELWQHLLCVLYIPHGGQESGDGPFAEGGLDWHAWKRGESMAGGSIDKMIVHTKGGFFRPRGPWKDGGGLTHKKRKGESGGPWRSCSPLDKNNIKYDSENSTKNNSNNKKIGQGREPRGLMSPGISGTGFQLNFNALPKVRCPWGSRHRLCRRAGLRRGPLKQLQRQEFPQSFYLFLTRLEHRQCMCQLP